MGGGDMAAACMCDWMMCTILGIIMKIIMIIGKENDNMTNNDIRADYDDGVMVSQVTWQELKDHMRAAGEVLRANVLTMPDGKR